MGRHDLLQKHLPMAAIGRFQKGDEIFYAKVVDGELFRLQGDVFGSPSYEKKPVPLKGVKTLTPVNPSKVIAVGLNYADHARESGKPIPKEPLFWLKAPTSLLPDGGKIEVPLPLAQISASAIIPPACPIACRVIRSTRLVISAAARRENVIRSIRRGSAPFTIRCATRCARVFVFPEPAPAMTRSGAPGVVFLSSRPYSTARRC